MNRHPAFALDARPGDRVRYLAGRMERAIEGVVHRAMERRPLLTRCDFRSQLGSLPVTAKHTRALHPPLIYLPALSWNQRYQRPQQLARAFASLGVPTLYLDSFRCGRLSPTAWVARQSSNLWRLEVKIAPRLDPFCDELGDSKAASVAKQIADTVRERPGFVLVQLPFWLPVALALKDRLGTPFVYDCADLHTAWPGIDVDRIAALERHVIAAADRITVTSLALQDHVRAQGREATIVANGAWVEDFVFPSGTPSRRVRLGYVGALREWVDIDTIREAARLRPDWDFVIAGRRETAAVDELNRLPNVELMGEIPYHSVAEFLSRLDAALIPFRDEPLTRAVDPVKLYEALAAGLPVLARRLPGVERWREPYMYLWTSAPELVTQAETAIRSSNAAIEWARRSIAERNTWSDRASSILSLVQGLGTSPRDERGECA